MTKQRYYEMCEMMGTEPSSDEIPVEYDDFPLEVQQAFSVYSLLRDEWEGFGGNYLGKNLGGLHEIFNYYEIDIADRKIMVQLIRTIDNIRIQHISKRKQQEQPAK
jgi:hypothetical protein